jgi:outer membrane protein W
MTTDSNCTYRFAQHFGGDASFKRRAARLAALTGIALALGVSAIPNVLAQTPDPAKQSAGPGTFYAFAGFAALDPQKNSGLNDKGSYANFMAGGGVRTSPNLAVELAFVLSAHDVDTPASATPPAGTFQAGTQDSSMGTAGLAATVKYNFTTGRFVPYAGGGVGFYSTRFSTTTEATGCVNNCNNNGPRVSAHSNDVGYHLLLGGDFYITPKDIVGAEVRYLKLDAEFGDVVPGKTHAGGTFLWLGYRRGF